MTVWQLAHVHVSRGGACGRFVNDADTDAKLYM